MAVTTSSIVEAAGISPKQYGTQVSVAALAAARMLQLVRRYIFEPGQEFFIPKFNARTATSAATQPATITFNALGGTKGTMTNDWSYDAIEINQQALSAMSAERLRITLESVIESAGQALANRIDGALLGLYASYTGTAVSATTGITAAKLREAISNLRMGVSSSTAPLPYAIVLHENEWDTLAGIDVLDQFLYRGDAPVLNATADGSFSYRKVPIVTTNNVPLSTNRRGAAFSGEAFGVAMRNMASLNEAFDINTMSQKVVIWMDFAYLLVRPEYALEVTGQTS